MEQEKQQVSFKRRIKKGRKNSVAAKGKVQPKDYGIKRFSTSTEQQHPLIYSTNNQQ